MGQVFSSKKKYKTYPVPRTAVFNKFSIYSLFPPPPSTHPLYLPLGNLAPTAVPHHHRIPPTGKKHTYNHIHKHHIKNQCIDKGKSHTLVNNKNGKWKRTLVPPVCSRHGTSTYISPYSLFFVVHTSIQPGHCIYILVYTYPHIPPPLV